MKSRLKFALLHLFISLLFCAGLILFFHFSSYRWPLSIAVNFWHIAVIFCLVDIVIGPFLTFIVYQKGKKSLKFDLSVIIFLQIAAFVYGAFSIFDARPAWIVYSVDRFELVKNSDIYIENLSKVKPEYQHASWVSPQYVAVQLAKDTKQHQQDAFNAIFAGLSLSKQPEKYIPLPHVRSEILAKMQNIQLLQQYNSSNLVKNILKKYPNASGFLPLKGHKEDMTVLLNKTGEVIQIVNLRPWK
ncbi:TfpX/TfpZ family type IV pilin accessory protein [Acinetobacter bohemicus]|uniref:TfpX/TfpZ family type IV pilin accessory protein n=1 Tax=Acinetobacter bohemicus TaxID=1435036 RepID=UPI003FA28DC6